MITITECDDQLELWRHYEGQSDAQDAYIELDLTSRALRADYNAEVGNAVPVEVYHGFTRRWAIPVLHAAAANRTLAELRPLAARIVADWESAWDGHNRVARLGADAEAADEAIGRRLEGAFDEADLVTEWGLDGAVTGDEAAEYGIGADTTDERLAQIEAQITADLAGCGPSPVAVVWGLDDYLTELRDGARAHH